MSRKPKKVEIPSGHWVVNGALPDSDMRVLMRVDDEEYPLVIGFHDGVEWAAIETDERPVGSTVIGWMELHDAAEILDGKRATTDCADGAERKG